MFVGGLPLVKQVFNHQDISIVIIGGGSIGVSFSLLFAKSQISVQLYEPDVNRIKNIKDELSLRIQDLLAYELIDTTKEIVLEQISLINDISEVNTSTDLVIECVPEQLVIKKDIFAKLDEIFSEKTIFVSASSAIMMSQIAEDIKGKNRCLIAHPGNPPHLIPIIELVPTEFTDLAVIERTKLIFESVGQVPVILNKEIEGFIFNRLQGAILREAYCLVRDGVASVEDIDKVMTAGLGLRWSVVGPFETVDLNTRGGIISHAEKMGSAYARMGAQRGQNDPWTYNLIEDVNQQRRKIVPLDKWNERVRWRDENIMSLLRYKKVRS